MRTLLITLVLLLITVPVMAASVTLMWEAPTLNEDGSPLTDLAGYRLFRGDVSGTYPVSVDVGNITIYSWDVGEQEGNTLFFNATAYDTSGNESVYNGEVNLTFPMIAPSPPTNLQGVVD